MPSREENRRRQNLLVYPKDGSPYGTISTTITREELIRRLDGEPRSAVNIAKFSKRPVEEVLELLHQLRDEGLVKHTERGWTLT